MGVQAYRGPYRLSLHIPSAHFTFRFLLDSIDSADYFRLNSSCVNFHCLIILVTFRFFTHKSSNFRILFCKCYSEVHERTLSHHQKIRFKLSILFPAFFFFLFLVLILVVILNLSPLQLLLTLTNAPSILN